MSGRIFTVPSVMTLALIGWWLYALTTNVHFPTNRQAVDNGGFTNAGAFNLVLMLLVGLSWAGATVLYARGGKSGAKR